MICSDLCKCEGCKNCSPSQEEQKPKPELKVNSSKTDEMFCTDTAIFKLLEPHSPVMISLMNTNQSTEIQTSNKNSNSMGTKTSSNSK